jgi:hypothetical protein
MSTISVVHIHKKSLCMYMYTIERSDFPSLFSLRRLYLKLKFPIPSGLRFHREQLQIVNSNEKKARQTTCIGGARMQRESDSNKQKKALGHDKNNKSEREDIIEV